VKKYLYKVYSPAGQLITTWTDVLGEGPEFVQEMNLPTSEMVLKLGRSADDFDEGVSVAFDNIVKVYVLDKELSSYTLFFQGRIVSYKPVYGGEEGVEVVLYTLGERMDNVIYRGPSIPDQTQDAGTSQTTFAGATKIAQSFIPDAATLTQIDVYLGCDVSTTVTLSIYTNSGGAPSALVGSAQATTSSSTPAKLRFTFDTPLTLVVGDTYWGVFTA